jgi:outer membrane receptor for ferrienterochelin and colicin
MFRIYITLFLVSTFFPIRVFAQETADSTLDLRKLSLTDLLNIEIITPSKINERLNIAPATVYVVTADEIAINGYSELSEILENIPGVVPINLDFFAVGGQRGFLSNFSQTLLMINGREMQNLIAAETFISHQFATHNIKQVEVMQGPASALYGANALVGIINIITKDGDKDFNGVECKTELGSEKTFSPSIVFAQTNKDFRLSGNFRFFKSDMWDFSSVVNDSLLFREGFTDDLYRNTFLYNNFSESTSGGLELRYKGFYFGSNFYSLKQTGGLEYVSVAYPGQLDTRNMHMHYCGFEHKFNTKLSLNSELQFYNETMYNRHYIYSQEKFDALVDEGKVPGTELSDEEISKQFTEVISQRNSPGSKRYRFNTHLYYSPNELSKVIFGYSFDYYDILGVSYSRNNLSPNFNTSISLDNPMRKPYFRQMKNSVFAQYQRAFFSEKIYLTLGMRLDYQEYYKDVYTFRGGFIYHPVNQTIVKLLFGQAFREPNIFEMGALSSVENTSLKPIKMNTVELSVSQNINKDVKAFITTYFNSATDFIEPKSTLEFKNSSDVKEVLGIESTLKARIGNFMFNLGYTYALNNNNTYKDKIVRNLGVYTHRANFLLSYKLTELIYLNARFNYYGKIKAYHGNAALDELIEIPAYLKIDPTISLKEYQYKQFSIYAAIVAKNLLDGEFYQPNIRLTGPKQFPQPGRQFLIKGGVRF